ncbi:GGDEF domain-containing protein [Sphingomonas sp. MMS24-J45]|uniref:GGDEF domain-containing protein n=1 Tax=Sphingomonas sp. MMS24-J45 TaxID=3238806 RepID=UPI00384A4FB8
MSARRQTRLVAVEDRSDHVFDCIRGFLKLHRLSPDPAHYAFAHRVICDPNGALAQSVATLTEGGVRLTARDIKALGGEIGTFGVGDAAAADEPAHADTLVAQTQMQVEGFTDMVRRVRADTEDFGRDLAASADAMRAGAGADNVILLTGLMLNRVQAAEARLAAATSEADQLREKLEEARGDARRDPLTGLPNRRAFEEAFAERMQAGETLCLAVVDVDRFKRVNDQFGHSVGDRVLRAIADALTAACPDHFVGRYGGEEFIILFYGLDLPAARGMLEAARISVASKRYRLRESDAPLGSVTFSGGLTEAEPGEVQGAVFGRADKLLYAAKDGGRNRIYAA